MRRLSVGGFVSFDVDFSAVPSQMKEREEKDMRRWDK